MMFGLGLTEIVVILVLVLILFGAGKLPGVMADMGKGLNAFKKGLDEGAAPAKAKPVAAKAAKPVAKKAMKKPAAKAKKRK